MQRDVLDHMDYALESKLWQAIGSNFDLTATVGQSWRVSEMLYTDNRQAGYGRLGVNIDLFDGSNLELAYGFNTTDGPLASHFRFSQGPTMVAHLKLAPGWSLDGSYSMTAVDARLRRQPRRGPPPRSQPPAQPEERLEHLQHHRRGMAHLGRLRLRADHHRRPGPEPGQPRRLGEFRAEFLAGTPLILRLLL